MKTTLLKIIIVSACILFVSKTNAQVWKLNGNNNIDTSHFLGTSNNASLIFKTNGFERGRFHNNGGFKVKGFFEADSGVFKGPLKISS